jgi:hypothetical protein
MSVGKSPSEGGRSSVFLLPSSQKGLFWLVAGVIGVALWAGSALLFHRSDGTQLINCGDFIARVWRDPVTGRLQPAELITFDRDGRPVCNRGAATR